MLKNMKIWPYTIAAKDSKQSHSAVEYFVWKTACCF